MLIPDTQVKPGVNTDHIAAAGRYAVNQLPDVIVMIGDWWDMPSLSTYETKGSKYFHDKTYRGDIEAGNVAMDRFMEPIVEERIRRVCNKKRAWNPRLVFCLGNHEQRIERAVNSDPILTGTISYDDFNLKKHGWEVHPYMSIVEIDGIAYSHCFANPDSLTKGNLSGTIENRLRAIGSSFSMGHQQTRKFGRRYTASGREHVGLVCGAFYSHNEEYLGAQGNNYWRGIIIKNEVCDGSYDLMEVSLRYLMEKWHRDP